MLYYLLVPDEKTVNLNVVSHPHSGCVTAAFLQTEILSNFPHPSGHVYIQAFFVLRPFQWWGLWLGCGPGADLIHESGIYGMLL